MRKLFRLSSTLILLGSLGTIAVGQAEAAKAACSLVISMPAKTVKAGSDIKLKVTIVNSSSEDINTSIKRLTLDVRDQRGGAVPEAARVSKVPRGGTFVGMVVQPGKSRDLDEILNTRFDLSKPGKYTVQATWQIGDQAVRSNKLTVNVVP